MKTEEPQNTQVVFGNARGRIANETHAPRVEIGKAAHIVVDRAVPGNRQRVDCEIAPLRITPPVAPKSDLGMPPERLDVLAQRCDFEWLLVGDDGNGAMLDSRGHRLEPSCLCSTFHLLRQRRGGDVDISDRQSEERVAHGTADDSGFLAAAVERGEQLAKRGRVEPFSSEPSRLLRHLVRPGTNWPFSVCAGT